MGDDPWEDASGFGWLALFIVVVLACVTWIMT